MITKTKALRDCDEGGSTLGEIMTLKVSLGEILEYALSGKNLKPGGCGRGPGGQNLRGRA
jgi:hypothetical protein